MKRICVVSGSRAEYGQLKPLLSRLMSTQGVQLEFVITGAHVDSALGNTQKEIDEDGIPVFARVPIPLGGDAKKDMASATGHGIVNFSSYFSDHEPDLLMVIGDRYETFAAATAAAILDIPIAHICGGSVTTGAVDEFFRHSITKMSILHFTTCEQYRRRVIQLGEDPARVYNVGSLAIENSIGLDLLSKEQLGASIGFSVDEPYCVVTFHPETASDENPETQLGELMSALAENGQYRYVITMANADAGSRAINNAWLEEGRKHRDWLVVQSLGVRRYLSALKHSEMMIGNSSSGTTEGPAMHIPVVNIGDRQKGRVLAESVICCPTRKSDISSAIRKAGSVEFKRVAARAENPFGDGRTSERIARIAAQFAASGRRSDRKAFYDIGFEVPEE
jgi:GDP/UDP-N,N'-diacetylbacillosamine 2-epimerase (hydrolysing)